MKRNYFNPYRNLICGVDEKIPVGEFNIHHINFDNAATTPPFKCVLEDILDFTPWYSSIHRGVGYKSKYSSLVYENSRKVIASFIGANLNEHTIIYVKNTTEAINKLSFRLCDHDKNCTVLSSSMEHHSNDLPWRDKFNVDYISLNDTGMLSIEDLEHKLISYDGGVKLVTITGASNTTGYINPIHEIARLVHSYDAKLLVDCAQLVPHEQFNMKSIFNQEHIDFVVFSSHKMYAPFGIGVLVGPKDVFCCGHPDYKGGGTVQLVTDDYALWDIPPNKEEAGTPNIMGVVALVSAIEMLQGIGMNQVSKLERDLLIYTLDKLSKIPEIKIYSSLDTSVPRVSIIPFNIEGIPHSITARILGEEWGISVRSGCFCAQPYMQKILNVSPTEIYSHLKNNLLPPYGVVRLSFGIYNTFSEIDFLVKTLEYIISHKESYLNKYSVDPIYVQKSPIFKTCEY